MGTCGVCDLFAVRHKIEAGLHGTILHRNACRDTIGTGLNLAVAGAESVDACVRDAFRLAVHSGQKRTQCVRGRADVQRRSHTRLERDVMGRRRRLNHEDCDSGIALRDEQTHGGLHSVSDLAHDRRCRTPESREVRFGQCCQPCAGKVDTVPASSDETEVHQRLKKSVRNRTVHIEHVADLLNRHAFRRVHDREKCAEPASQCLITRSGLWFIACVHFLHSTQHTVHPRDQPSGLTAFPTHSYDMSSYSNTALQIMNGIMVSDINHMSVLAEDHDAEVIIIGAGPTGLMSANLLGLYGIRTIVIEANPELIDYPRGVGMDDETLRTFQTAGLASQVLPHTIPHQLLVFVDRRRRDLARISPPMADFGWPRRNGFVQPLADRVLLEGLERYPHVSVEWNARLISFTQSDGVQLDIETPTGRRVLRSAFLIGADGGRSVVRKTLDVPFTGTSSSEDWLVIDVNDDPLGQPGAYVGADPRRPYASISIPHGIRRFEFMLLPNETPQDAEDEQFVRKLMVPFIGNAHANIIRHRVYTHHSRIAGAFRTDRALLAGDAAHLMAVWQGQGYNSGIRDAFNLSWKLALVVKGLAEVELLDSYDSERRAHAEAMIQLSRWVGNVISTRNRFVAGARDVFFRTISHIPKLKLYIVQMRFKPMPRMQNGALSQYRRGADSPTGQLFIQPFVHSRDHVDIRMDEVIGPWFALVAWNNDPSRLLTPEARAFLASIGAKLFTIRPASQLSWNDPRGEEDPVTVIGDIDGSLKRWFDARHESVLLLRPDRIIAGAAPAHAATEMVLSFAEAIHAKTSDPSPERSPA